jgi:flavin-dependent dehydrogenase
MMDTCDVLVVGGGPAGSSCAWSLRRAGLDVVVIDRATFPRDKVCAGWITPQVVDDLQFDLHEYAHGRTLQRITGFRTGLIGAPRTVETAYGETVSFGIRRCEFDHYLLQRSHARLALGMAIASIRRERDAARWVVNETIAAPMLVGAGGHFCPVARWLNPTTDRGSIVAAQEMEFLVEPDSSAPCRVVPERPELYFCRDLKGYGWCFRKQRYINVGFGRADRRSLPTASAAFVEFLYGQGTLPRNATGRWRGHAYLLSRDRRPQVVDAGVLLAGDAAGLAYPQSGEGIRPAIESGLLAAATVLRANGDYSLAQLEPYETSLRARFGAPSPSSPEPASPLPGPLDRMVPWLFARPWFVRHLVLNRGFLRSNDAAFGRPRASGHGLRTCRG